MCANPGRHRFSKSFSAIDAVPTEVLIRPARTDDAGAIQAIYAPLVEHTAISFEETVPTVWEMVGRIVSTQKTHPYLVAKRMSGCWLCLCGAAPDTGCVPALGRRVGLFCRDGPRPGDRQNPLLPAVGGSGAGRIPRCLCGHSAAQSRERRPAPVRWLRTGRYLQAGGLQVRSSARCRLVAVFGVLIKGVTVQLMRKCNRVPTNRSGPCIRFLHIRRRQGFLNARFDVAGAKIVFAICEC